MKKLISMLSIVMLMSFYGSASAAVIGNLNFSGDLPLTANSNIRLAGACDAADTEVDEVGTVAMISVVQNGTGTLLGSYELTGPQASFEIATRLPASFTSTAAVITAVCPDGDMLVLNLDAPTDTAPPTPAAVNNNDAGDVGGVSTTPEGGVAAGSAEPGAIGGTVLVVLLLIVFGWLFVSRSPINASTG